MSAHLELVTRDTRRNNVLLKAIDQRLDGIQEMIEEGNIKQALRALVAVRTVTKGSGLSK